MSKLFKVMIMALLVTVMICFYNAYAIGDPLKGATVKERFDTPPGTSRVSAPRGSFAAYLRNLSLQPEGSPVHLYNGTLKRNQGVHDAVVAMDIGDKNLQQCADAVMRLRAEYLFKQGRYRDIHFNFTNGFRADYYRWRSGERISVYGNSVQWVRGAKTDTSYSCFRKYLDVVFAYAGTLSLSRELVPVSFKEMQPGDVLIQGGSPGHAVIVVDMAEGLGGKKFFMLAQSYMPAQEIHVLNNMQKLFSSWYELKPGSKTVETPQWDFETSQLMRFREQ